MANHLDLRGGLRLLGLHDLLLRGLGRLLGCGAELVVVLVLQRQRCTSDNGFQNIFDKKDNTSASSQKGV